MIYVLIIALAAGLILYAIVLGSAKKAPKRGGGGVAYLDPAAVTQRWQTIMMTSEMGATGLKSSISDADKLFDHVLRQQNFKGNTMAKARPA